MKSVLTSRRLLQRLTWLLCAGLFALAFQVSAAGKKRHSSSGRSSTHHYNSHYSGHSRGPSRSNSVYSHGYRGHSSYGHSSYGRSSHFTLTFRL
jgi:hypothetical protein